jgi:N12 class adenine-specific DNA methylase
VGSGASGGPGIPTAPNYTAVPGALRREGSWHKTAERNLDVIELVQKLEAEGRPATPEEQELLAKYTGWGASEIANGLFPPHAIVRGQGETHLNPDRIYDPKWKATAERAAKLLRGEALEQAARSTQYAHYTSEEVVRGIWTGLGRMGFKGGKILEPGMGVGLFPVMAPEAVMGASRYTGIEFDSFTARIAKFLLPRENVLHADYVRQKLPDGFFDLAIGNPPFAKQPITEDPAYRKNRFSLHDYFFAKSLDKVRPGGLLVFVTSRYTMDKLDDKARAFMAERANLLGAIRLPQTAFKHNAGTEVVTDILFLQRRVPGDQPGGVPWLAHKEVKIAGGDPVMINEYFVDHPEMVLGRHSREGSMYRDNEYTVAPLDRDIADLVNEAVGKLPEGVFQPFTRKANEQRQQETIERDLQVGGKKEGQVYVGTAGALMRVENGAGIALASVEKVSAAEATWLREAIGLRDAIKKAQRSQLDDTLLWENDLRDLNQLYDGFVQKHGQIRAFTTFERKSKNEDGEETTTTYYRFKNERLWDMDVEGQLLPALENLSDDGVISKSNFLRGRTLRKPARPEINSTQDAYLVSLDERGRLDLDHIAELAKKTREQVIEEMGTAIYQTPQGEWQTEDEYLSGDVRTKLEEAKAAAINDRAFQRNVKALQERQPRPLTASEIGISLGAGWVPPEHITRFAEEVLGETTTIRYEVSVGKWDVTGSEFRKSRGSGTDWGTADRTPLQILEAVLNNRQIKITRSERGPPSRTWTDQEATAQANAVAEKMRDSFKGWVWTDSNRAAELLGIYNERYNNIAPRRFDGSHLQLPGLSLKYELHPHQKRAVWRVIQSGNTYLAHAVGAGKTLEMIVSAMEQRRLGLIRKPMFVVPNHMLNQFAAEFMDAYPAAKIMVADEKAFHTTRRQRFVAQAALNDLDGVVVTHSAFGLMQTREQTRARIVGKIIADLQAALDSLGDGRETRISRKKIEKQIEGLERKFLSRVGEGKDEGILFEDLGVDFTYIDEAHEFRKLDFATDRENTKGIDPQGSFKALDLYVKTRWLDEERPGRGMVFASGTPVTNTMAELFTAMRFMDEAALERDGIQAFDAWAQMFGEVSTQLEQNAGGVYEPVSRFSKFINVPELMKRARSFMDVLTSSQLKDLVKVPEVRGGSPENVVVMASAAQKAYMEVVLKPRIKQSREWKPSREQPGNPDPLINIITDGQLSAIDLRFVDPRADNDPNSKLNRMIDEIIASYHATADDVYHDDDRDGQPEPIKGSAQIVFSALGFGEQVAKTRGFDPRAWMMKRFAAAGIPASAVAWRGDYDTQAKRQEMFKKVREGRIRILIGSPKNMGTGVNVQKRLKVLHFLTPPWYPSDVEQPHGRIIRQGNQNAQVEIKWYATKGTYDSTKWGMVARKGRFIEQAFMGEESLRVIDDMSETSQYEMASAMAAGDERAIRLANLNSEIDRLQLLQGAHHTDQMRLRSELQSANYYIDTYKEKVAQYRAAEKERGEHIFEPEIKVGDETYTKHGTAGDALYARAQLEARRWKPATKDSRTEVEIGTLKGKHRITAQLEPTDYFVEGKKEPTTSIRIIAHVGPVSREVDHIRLYEDQTNRGVQLTQGILRFVNGIPNERKEYERLQAKYEEEKKAVRARIGTPFEREGELHQKLAERAQLIEELRKEGEAANNTTVQGPEAVPDVPGQADMLGGPYMTIEELMLPEHASRWLDDLTEDEFKGGSPNAEQLGRALNAAAENQREDREMGRPIRGPVIDATFNDAVTREWRKREGISTPLPMRGGGIAIMPREGDGLVSELPPVPAGALEIARSFFSQGGDPFSFGSIVDLLKTTTLGLSPVQRQRIDTEFEHLVDNFAKHERRGDQERADRYRVAHWLQRHVLIPAWEAATNDLATSMTGGKTPDLEHIQKAREIITQAHQRTTGRGTLGSISRNLSEALQALRSRSNQKASEELEKLRAEPVVNFGRYAELRAKVSPEEAVLLRLEEGIRAFHGSGADFGRFDLSKLGTGEGAQAFGWGLYFADQEAVAQVYKRIASQPGGSIGGLLFRKTFPRIRQMADHIAEKIAVNPFQISLVLEQLANGVALDDVTQAFTGSAEDHAKIVSYLRRNPPSFTGKTPRLYEVELNVQPDNLLDWDKPISQQPEAVRQALTQLGVGPNDNVQPSYSKMPQPTGQDAYRALSAKFLPERKRGPFGKRSSVRDRADYSAADKAASLALLAQGIPGLRFLDASSRSTAQKANAQQAVHDASSEVARLSQRVAQIRRSGDTTGIAGYEQALEKARAKYAEAQEAARETRNYVIFDDRLVEIQAVREGQGAAQTPLPWIDFLERADITNEREAEDWIRRVAKASEDEFMAIVADGEPIAAGTSGQPGIVGWPPIIGQNLGDPTLNAHAIHNHPNSSSLSSADVASLALGPVSRITAIGKDGAKYSARFQPEFFTTMASRFGNDSALALNEAIIGLNRQIAGRLMLMVTQGSLTMAEADIAYSRMSNVVLHDAGVISYSESNPPPLPRAVTGPIFRMFREKLADDLRKELARTFAAPTARRGIGSGARRPAQPVRAAGPVADLDRGSAQGRARGAGAVRGRDAGVAAVSPEERPSFVAPPPRGPLATLAHGVTNLRKRSWWRDDFLPRFIQQNVNHLDPIARGEVRRYGTLQDGSKSAFKLAEMAAQDSGRFETILHDGPLVWNVAEQRVDFDPEIGGLLSQFDQIQGEEDYDAFQGYAIARRAQRLLKEGRERLLTQAEISRALNVTPEQKARYDAMLAKWERFNNRMLDFLVDTSVISKNDRDAYASTADYVPFYRMIEETGEVMSPRDLRRGLSNPDPGFRRLVGGTSKIDDLMENISRNTRAMASAGMRNVAMTYAHDMYAELGELTEGPGDGAVTYYRAGQKRHFRPHDPAVFAALAAQPPENMSRIYQAMRGLAAIFRAGITLSPPFMVANALRGFAAGYVQTGENVSFRHNTLTGFTEALRSSTALREIRAITGMGGYKFGPESPGLSGRSLRRQTGAESYGIIGRLSQAVDYLEKLGEATEMAERVAIYQNARARGVDKVEAAYRAMNLINYNRRGLSRSLRFLIPLVPFLNARIQGLYRMFENHGDRRILPGIALRGMLLMAVSAGLWALANWDEEDRKKYDAEPLERKINYYIIYAGDRKILIPKPFEFGALFSTLPEAILNWASKENGGKDMATIAAMTFLNTFGFNPIPQAVKPLLEVVTNWDFFRGRPLEGMSDKRLAPNLRIDPTTSSSARAIGQVTGQMGPFSLSPIQVQHLLEGYGGVWGAMLLAGTDAIAGAGGVLPAKPTGALGSVPVVSTLAENVVGRFIKRADVDYVNRWIGDLYEMKRKADEVYNSARYLRTEGDAEGARELMTENRGLMAMRSTLSKTTDRLSDITKAINRIRADTSLTGPQMRDKLDPLVKQRNALAQRVRELAERQMAKAA